MHPLPLHKPPQSILVITYGGHGDILLTTPMIASLAQSFPAAPIDVYLQKGRGGMLAGNPHVRAVLEAKHRNGVLSYTDFFLHHTRAYDLTVSVRSSDRQILFCRAAGRRAISLVPLRGENRLWKKAILDGWASDNCERHTVVNILQLAEVLGIEKIYACRPPFDPTSEARLAELLPFDRISSPYAVMSPMPRNPYKEWTPHGWKAVARHLCERGLRVLLLGGSSEYERRYITDLSEDLPTSVINLAGRTSFADAAALLSRCQVYIGPDTAMTHLAAVLKTPLVALYGHTNVAYMPYHETLSRQSFSVPSPNHLRLGHVNVVIGQCTCAADNFQCKRHTLDHSDCMRSIPANMITAILDRLLEEKKMLRPMI